MSSKIPVCVARGDGIGPEIMEATLFILDEAGASLDYHEIELGEKIYLKGIPTGIEQKCWETIRQTKAILKAPITTPQGKGFKSLNVTLRTTLGLYANVRPCRAYGPFVDTLHPKMDLVIVRENEEDLYTGVEYRLSPHVCQSLKIISRQGSEKIVRYAFEYARQEGRKKVTCFTKDNIMKLSDGLFHSVFETVAKEYPEIASEHWIVDIGAAKLADSPEEFDVIVLPNLYGDILSDVAAQISGSVGLAGSANIGCSTAMFEAIHGSAPRIAGKNVANPSGLLQAAILMLLYLGEPALAERIQNAYLRTLEEGIHTHDIFVEAKSKRCVSTQEFAQAVVKFLGQKPQHLKCASYKSASKLQALALSIPKPTERNLVGVDLFLYSTKSREAFTMKLSEIKDPHLALAQIRNRGVRIWPGGQSETSCIEEWCCRFMAHEKGKSISPMHTIQLMQHLTELGHDIIMSENLYTYDGNWGFSAAEG